MCPQSKLPRLPIEPVPLLMSLLSICVLHTMCLVNFKTDFLSSPSINDFSYIPVLWNDRDELLHSFIRCVASFRSSLLLSMG